jgi:hypothetical protein
MMAILLALMLLTGCTPEREQGELFAPEYLDVLVVDAALIVGQPLPPIKLTRTQAPNEPFDPAEAAERNATMTVTVDQDTITYANSPASPWIYWPEGPWPLVQPETTYELLVEIPGGERLTARTTTPSVLAMEEWVLLNPSGTSELRTLRTFAEAGDAVYESPENQIDYAEGLVEGRIPLGGPEALNGYGYQLALFSLDLGSDYVIDPPFFEEEDFEDLARQGSSPPLNGVDGGIRLPWFAIYYEGRHLYKIYVLDRNWYDLVRSIPQTDGGLGFGGNIGDAFDQPIFNISGGIGLFGSASVDSVGFYIHPGE